MGHFEKNFMNAVYSESEARSQVGTEVVTVADLPDIPKGTRGRIIDTVDDRGRGWILRVQWDLPPKRSEVMAQVMDISFNIPWKIKRPLAEFDKAEVASSLKRVEE
jgi:hypothetical protein